jgi:hypothetical protein
MRRTDARRGPTQDRVGNMPHTFWETTMTETNTQIRELTVDEQHAVTGGALVWTSPAAIRGFNPQPDPPAFQVVVLASPQL